MGPNLTGSFCIFNEAFIRVSEKMGTLATVLCSTPQRSASISSMNGA